MWPAQVFEYQSVVRNTGFTNHFPVHEMNCAAKLRSGFNFDLVMLYHMYFHFSCVAYNPYHKHHLVSSDYEGCVCVWDTNIGRRTALHQVQPNAVLHIQCVYCVSDSAGTWQASVVCCLQPSRANSLCFWK